MRDWFTFDPVISTPVSLFLIILAASVILWKEYSSRRIGILSVLGVAFAILGLSGIFLQPSRLIAPNSVVILLTRDYDPRLSDSLFQAYPRAKVYTAPGVRSGMRSVTPLSSWHELPGIGPVDVVTGEGLPPHALDLMQDKRMVFLPSAPATAFTKLTVPRPIKANRPYELRGEYRAIEPTLLTLRGPGGISDSINVDAGFTSISLTFTPKNVGPLTLTLTEKSKKNTITHRLGVTVEKPGQRAILFLQDYPSFENSYLKNFLAPDHAIAVRYRLSKNVFRYEYVNIKTQSPQTISKEFLDRFDIAVTTPAVLKTLTRSEKTAIESAVAGGLGILFIGMENGIVAFGPDVKTEKSSKDTIHVSLTPLKKTTLHTDRYLLSPQPSLNPVLMQGEKPLIGYVNQGLGRIGYSVLTETYPLLLRGDSLSYAKLWIPVLESISRRRALSPEIRILSLMPFLKDLPIHLEIFTTSVAPVMYYDSAQIPVREDPRFANRWNATIWPSQQGWNEIKSENDSTILSFFVNGPDEWHSLQSYRNTELTRIHAVSEINQRETQEWQPIHPLLFFALFLSGMSMLWLLPKLK